MEAENKLSNRMDDLRKFYELHEKLKEDVVLGVYDDGFQVWLPNLVELLEEKDIPYGYCGIEENTPGLEESYTIYLEYCGVKFISVLNGNRINDLNYFKFKDLIEEHKVLESV